MSAVGVLFGFSALSVSVVITIDLGGSVFRIDSFFWYRLCVFSEPNVLVLTSNSLKVWVL